MARILDNLKQSLYSFVHSKDNLRTVEEQNLNLFQITYFLIELFLYFILSERRIVNPELRIFDILFAVVGLSLVAIANYLLRKGLLRESKIVFVFALNLVGSWLIYLSVRAEFDMIFFVFVLTPILTMFVFSTIISLSIFIIDLIFLTIVTYLTIPEPLANFTLPMFFELFLAAVIIVFLYHFLTSNFQRQDRILEENQTYTKSILNNLPVGIGIGNLKGVAIDCNQSMLDILGYKREEFIGKHFSEFTHEEDAPLTQNAIKRLFTGEVDKIPILRRYIKRSGEVIWCESITTLIRNNKGEPVNIMGMLQDITDQIAKEDEEKEAMEIEAREKRLESIGLLASGIAHDFNNIIAVINGYSELLLQTSENPTQMDLIEEIIRSGKKAALITKQLLSYSEKHKFYLVPENMNVIINDLIGFSQMALSEYDIELSYDLAGDLHHFKAERSQITQVIMNLIINARDAIGSRKGNIIITTRNLDDEKIQLIIEDNGSGIKPEYLSKLFDPYFSTKEESSGMGLSIVHNIIDGHGGTIDIDTKVGKGTKFIIEFPKTDEPLQLEVEETEKKTTYRLLIIDDEEELTTIISRNLARQGYEIEVYNNPIEALDAYKNSINDPVDLVISDIRMPEMSGIELVKTILNLREEQKIFFITGFGNRVLDKENEMVKNIPILNKPFSSKDLEKQITDILR